MHTNDKLAQLMMQLITGDCHGPTKLRIPNELMPLIKDYQEFAKETGGGHQSYEKIVVRLMHYGAAFLRQEMATERTKNV